MNRHQYILLFIGLIASLCAAQVDQPLSELPDKLIILDKEQANSCPNTVDTITIDLPLVRISNKRLKRAIDNFVLDCRLNQDFLNPICLYMRRFGKGKYEFWAIVPAMGFRESFFQKYTIGFYQTEMVYIFIDESAQKDVKKIKGSSKQFTLLSDYEIMNIDPVLMFDLENMDLQKPIIISL